MRDAIERRRAGSRVLPAQHISRQAKGLRSPSIAESPPEPKSRNPFKSALQRDGLTGKAIRNMPLSIKGQFGQGELAPCFICLVSSLGWDECC